MTDRTQTPPPSWTRRLPCPANCPASRGPIVGRDGCPECAYPARGAAGPPIAPPEESDEDSDEEDE